MKKNISRYTALILVLFGLFLVLNASVPIIQYEIFSFSQLSPTELLSPVPKPIVAAGTTETYNLTRASNWFIGTPDLPDVQSKVKYYNISVPRLKIEDATVEIGGEDLEEALIHYPGTSLPGQLGNAVIFGHSSLPQFFNPKNYLTIFTKLPALKKGDDILVNYDGIKYTFRVETLFEVMPTDIQVLEQRYDDSYLTLVTCVPPGTYLRRLIIKARIVPKV